MVALKKPLAKFTFVAGEMIVYPGHGVGKVNRVLKQSFAGVEASFLEISIEQTGMKVMIPIMQAESNGLRKIVDKREVTKIYSILKDRTTKVDSQTWNRRSREYDQKLKTGSVYKIAEVLRDLFVLSLDKELSTGEKDMLGMAKNLLAAELAIVKNRTADKIIDEIEQLVANG